MYVYYYVCKFIFVSVYACMQIYVNITVFDTGISYSDSATGAGEEARGGPHEELQQALAMLVCLLVAGAVTEPLRGKQAARGAHAPRGDGAAVVAAALCGFWWRAAAWAAVRRRDGVGEGIVRAPVGLEHAIAGGRTVLVDCRKGK